MDGKTYRLTVKVGKRTFRDETFTPANEAERAAMWQEYRDAVNKRFTHVPGKAAKVYLLPVAS